MQPKNFKDKIAVELDTSCEYMKEAINSIKSYPKWSNRFRVMSEDRYEHAEQLYKMFMELYIDTKDQDAYMNSIRDAIVELFATKTRLIDGYRATYDLVVDSSESLEEETEHERDITKPGDDQTV